MVTLTPNESRVLGVLIEKAQTTPGQYPLTFNALVNGCNQKNNRDPVTNLNEDDVIEAIDGLRAKELAREVMMSGSRVAKYRHLARETFQISTSELVVMAELLMRGSQTVGELRGRASRMHPLESTAIVENILENLQGRENPFVRKLAPSPGSRANRYVQLLCPNLHQIDEIPEKSLPQYAKQEIQSSSTVTDLTQRVENLEQEVAHLQEQVRLLNERNTKEPTLRPID